MSTLSVAYRPLCKFQFFECLEMNMRNENIFQQSHNKMANIDQVLKMNNHKYPFGENPCFSAIKVEQTQFFASVESLLEKKSEMLRKKEMIKNPGIIGLLSVTDQGNVLHYEWQYVPYSISSYVRSKFNAQNNDIWEMTKNLLIKKVTFELTMLMSYLAKMRIETQLSMQTLGISHDEKLKLYLSPRSKMGIRSELFLISHYGQAKDRIIRELRAELQLIQNNPDNPNFKGTRPYFENKMLSNSFIQSVTSNSLNRNLLSPKIKKPSKNDEIPIRRKMSYGNFEFGHKNDSKPLFEKQRRRSPQTPRQHKYSFQFNNDNDRNEPPHSESFKEAEEEGLVNHSKSIKIELEQRQNMDSKRQRKDSYKVKITTYREYEVDDPNLFKQNCNNEDDIFEYFAKQAQKQEHEERKSHKEHTFEPENEWKGERHQQGVNTTAPSSPPPSPLISAKQIFDTNQKGLQQRIRMARERSQRILTMMKSMKK